MLENVSIIKECSCGSYNRTLSRVATQSSYDEEITFLGKLDYLCLTYVLPSFHLLWFKDTILT